MLNYWREVPNARQRALECFTPQMFIICMGTGILAVQLHNNPYQFRGVISVVVWLLDMILFVGIAAIFITRCIRFPSSTSKLFETDIEQTTYLSTSTIALTTIIELVSLICGSTWTNWQYVSFALWWIAVAWALITTTTVYWLLIRDEEVSMSNLSPTLMYPTTGLAAAATAGSVVVSYTPLSDWLSMPVIIVSYIMAGAGFFLGLLTISSYFLRLLSHQTPSPKKVAAQLIPMAVLSNAAYSFASLGYVVGSKREVFKGYHAGPVSNEVVAIYGAGFVLGLAIFGLATFWLLLAIVAFIRDVRKTHFNLNMWSGAYPIGIYAIACTQFSIDLDSTAFRVLSTILLFASVFYWLFLVIFTVPMVLSGELYLRSVKEDLERD